MTSRSVYAAALAVLVVATPAWAQQEATAEEAAGANGVDRMIEASRELMQAGTEAAAAGWEKTKEVSGKAWEKTKEVSGKAWETTEGTAGRIGAATKRGYEAAVETYRAPGGTAGDEADGDGASRDEGAQGDIGDGAEPASEDAGQAQ